MPSRQGPPAGRQFGLPRLAEIRIRHFCKETRLGGGPVTPVAPPQPTVHDAASCFTGLVLGVPACASAARVDSGLFCRNAMSQQKSLSLKFAVLSRGHQEVHRPRPVTACQGIPLTKGYNYVTAEGRDQACRFLASLGFPWIFRDSRSDSASTTEQGSCYCCRCTRKRH